MLQKIGRQKFIVNNRGFSLIEGMVMLGILAVISTGAASTITNMINDFQQQRSRQNGGRLAEQIKGQLSNSDACTKTLNGIPLNASTNVDVTNIRDIADNSTHAVNGTYGNGSVIINSIKVSNYADTTAPAGTAKMQIAFESPQRPGIINMVREFEINTTKTGGVLSACSAGVDSGGTDGPWTSVNDKIYTMVNVGVGTDSPVARLDVKGGKMQAQLDCRVVVGPTIDYDPSIANCNADEYVIGGGGYCRHPVAASYGAALHQSQPLADMSGWLIDCYGSDPGTAMAPGVFGTAHAICCKK